MIRIMLADDHAVVREGVKAILNRSSGKIAIVGEARNGVEVLELAKKHPADVYILDIGMPQLNGLLTAERLLRIEPTSLIIFLSMYDNKAFLEKSVQLGVRGYVLKESVAEDILEAIDCVYSGGKFFSKGLGFVSSREKANASAAGQCHPGTPELTNREKEVLQLISEGLSTKEIAYKLGRSVHTVHIHRENLMRKLDIHNQPGLVRYALKEGLSQL